MTVQQLEYVIAVDNHRHFAKAADACFVTQPTLSMMIQKLEEELDVKIFNRSTHPIEPTEIGKQIIKQARVSLKYFKEIKEIVENEKNTVFGSFKLGIIPTVASYLVPEILRKTDSKSIELSLKESPTHEIIEYILNGKLDGGLAATPLNHPSLVEYPIYYEKFYAYVSPYDKYYEEDEIDLEKVDVKDIWLLENVHCLRGQIQKLCQLKRNGFTNNEYVKYEAGSIDTLINIVDYNKGITIIPEMTAMCLPEEKQGNLKKFKDVTSVREVSLVVSQEYVRKKMIREVIDIIKNSVPKSMQDPKLKKFTLDVF
jgi:Transcriptional regulator